MAAQLPQLHRSRAGVAGPASTARVTTSRSKRRFATRRGPATPWARSPSALTFAFGGIVAIITILILTFYLLVESDSLFAAFARLFPRAERPRVEEVASKISTKVSAWLNGQLILAGMIGVTAAIGLYFLGVPYFYVLALVAALGEMIPVVGPIFSAVPRDCRGADRVSPRTAIFTALFMVAQQQFENHVLVPKVMERQVGVSAVTVIIALLIGGFSARHSRRDPGGSHRSNPPGRGSRAARRTRSAGGRGA